MSNKPVSLQIKSEKVGGERGAEYIVLICRPGAYEPVHRVWVSHTFEAAYNDCIDFLDKQPWLTSIATDRVDTIVRFNEKQSPCAEQGIVNTHTIYLNNALYWATIKLQFHQGIAEELEAKALVGFEQDRCRIWGVLLENNPNEAVKVWLQDDLSTAAKAKMIPNLSEPVLLELFKRLRAEFRLNPMIVYATATSVWQKVSDIDFLVCLLDWLKKYPESFATFAKGFTDETWKNLDPRLTERIAPYLE